MPFSSSATFEDISEKFDAGAKSSEAVFNYRYTSFYFTSLCALCRYYIFYKLICSNSTSNCSVAAIYLTAFVHFAFLCHVLVILMILQTFHYYYVFYGDLWPVIFAVTNKKINYSLKVLMNVSSFSNKVFLFKVYILYLKNNPLAHLKYYNIA